MDEPKVFVNDEQVEAYRVDFILDDYPEDGEQSQFKMTSEGLLVDVVDMESGEVIRTGYQFFDDLVEIAH